MLLGRWPYSHVMGLAIELPVERDNVDIGGDTVLKTLDGAFDLAMAD